MQSHLGGDVTLSSDNLLIKRHAFHIADTVRVLPWQILKCSILDTILLHAIQWYLTKLN